MDKKGDSLLEKQLIWAFYLILVVVVYFMISGISTEKSYYEDYLVRNLGLSLDALHNAPGELSVYHKNLNDVTVNIKENVVEVRSSTKTPKVYLFTRDKNFQQIDSSFNFNNSTLKISKDKDIYLENE